MKINFDKAKQELEQYMESHKKWVLSTSYNDYITTRTMSTIHQGVHIYFQTNKCYIKSEQMKHNQNVALCSENVSIEGIVKDIGNWNQPENKELMELYKSVHLSSFEAYGFLDGQTVYMVIPQKVKIWKYVEGNPLREQIDFINQTAEQLEFM